MWQIPLSLARLCLFAFLAGCSVDLSGLGASTDAAMSPDPVFPIGDLGGSADAQGGLESRGRGGAGNGAGGSGEAGTGSSTVAGGSVGGDGSAATGGSSQVGGTGGSGGAWSDGGNLAADTAGADGVKGNVDGALDGASEVAGDRAPTTYDSGGTDRAMDSADGVAASPEVGAADVPDLGTDRYDAGGRDEGDASCLTTDCIPFIVPSYPAAMKCNVDGSIVELRWTDLSGWDPIHDSRKCDTAGAYYIQGNIVQFQPGLQVLAEVYAPEDSTWYPISGGPMVQPDTTGGFDGYFCLPQKGIERTFRFRLVQQNTSQDAGVACLIHVRR